MQDNKINNQQPDDGELVKVLEIARKRIVYLASPYKRHIESNEKTYLPIIDEALAKHRKTTS